MTIDDFAINSNEWWEMYFSQGMWKSFDGEGQTQFFGKVLIENLPDKVRKNLEGVSICDLGCAEGEATDCFEQVFGNGVEGVDISFSAIQAARNKYPHIKFLCTDFEDIQKKYDSVICSNVLEHLENYLHYIEKMCLIAKRYVIIMVPYKDCSGEPSHINYFDEKSFPVQIKDFCLVYEKVIDTSEIENTYWKGQQKLFVYEKCGKRGIKMDNKLVPLVETWDKVAETYKIEIENSEREIADAIALQLEKIGIYPGASLVELGCGSGHLSACLAQKGYKTALVDFSDTALEKAKETYRLYQLEGEFIHGDLMEKNMGDSVYDLAWNSGVMEHFGDHELQIAIMNAASYAKKGVFFVVPNSKSISYNLMRARLMSKGKWEYGIEYLRDDYDIILRRLGFENVNVSYLNTSGMSANHMLVANEGSGDLNDLYELLMEKGFLPDSEGYLAVYSALKSKVIEVSQESEYRGDTETKTQIFDLTTENYGLVADRQKVGEIEETYQRKIELLEKQLAECHEECARLQTQFQNKIKNSTEEISHYKEQLQNTKEQLKSTEERLKIKNDELCKRIDELEEKTIQQKESEERLIECNQNLTDVRIKLQQKERIIHEALAKCNEMLGSKLFKMTHLLYRTKYQGFNNTVEEKKRYRKWVMSQLRRNGGDADRRYNPLYGIVQILEKEGETLVEDTIGFGDSLNTPLGEHLSKEKIRLSVGEYDQKEVDEIRRIIASRKYKGVLVYPHVVYWEPLQTPQQLLRAFAQTGWLCFFCEHPNLKDAFREVEENVIIVHEKEFLRAVGDTNVTILLTWMGSLAFVESVKNKTIWYHILDKLDLFPYYDDSYYKLHQNYERKAECVSYVATPLLECLKERKDAVYLPNGVNPDEFVNIHEDYIPEDMKGIVATGHKIIGYYGYLAEWMDYDMVRQAAQLRPEYEFVFIGKAIYDTSKIENVPNIHLLGLKPYKELSDYAKLFDVATIPFVINEKMDCVSPIKFYEYCAMGLPVVTSRMKEMEKEVCEFVACANGVDEYLFYLDHFTKEDIKKIAAEQAGEIAERNTWLARANRVEYHLMNSYMEVLEKPYDKFDVIILGVIDYDFRFQRPQHFAVRFAKNGHRVFYINANHYKPDEIRKIDDNLYVINIHNEKESAIHLTDWKDQLPDLYAKLDVVANQYCIRDAITIVDYPNWIYAADYFRENYGFKIITDYMDDYTGFLNPAEKLVEENCKRLLELSDEIIASSKYLQEIAEKYQDKVEIVRNGTEFNHFNCALKKTNNIRKIVGYYGAVAEWFEYKMVLHLAKNIPDCDVVIIGNVTKWNKELSQYPNIKLLGEKPYKDLPQYLETFDVCLIPFDTSTDLIKATNPVKFYEYLSAGKKIVATEIPELEPYKNKYVYMSNDKDKFVEYVKLCLTGEDTLAGVDECVQFARENDWQKRYEMFAALCKNTTPRISIVVLTYNNLDINKMCINSILSKTAYPNYELIIVDNNSQDGTREYLKELQKTNPEIKIILNESNMGFAAGNNVGIKESSGDYVVLLNNDTIVTRGWLTALSKHLENDPKLGMCGPVTNSIGNEAKIKVDYHDFPGLDLFAYQYTTQHLNEEFRDVRVLALFCTMIRKQVIQQCGLLDESYGIGMFEDDDYAEMVKRAGYELTIAEDAYIHHFESVSFKKLEDETFKKLYEENKQKFEKKWNMKWEMHKKRPGIKWDTNIDVNLLK